MTLSKQFFLGSVGPAVSQNRESDKRNSCLWQETNEVNSLMPSVMLSVSGMN